ncbi:MAG: response regulator [Candidatus Hodarchaeales archaeon]
MVSGYELPGVDGLEFLEKVRNLSNDIPFIIFTGHDKEEIADRARNKNLTVIHLYRER